VRWGGEEFLIILNKTDPAHLDRLAQKVLRAVKESAIQVAEDIVIHKTCSIGYGQIPFCRSSPEFLSLEQTIKLSDYAMYVAKQSGRNRAVRISLKEGLTPSQDLHACLMALSRKSGHDTRCIDLTQVFSEA
jgi:diguanylate cyclase (GGDEF)-like protein